MINIYDIYFDGACDNNSKFKLAGAGVAVRFNSEYSEGLSKAKFIGTNGTNNTAEWEALILALNIAAQIKERDEAAGLKVTFRLFGDSKLVVEQFNGAWRIKSDNLKSYLPRAVKVKKVLGDTLKGVTWIPRQGNKEADKLSKKAITDYIESWTIYKT